MCESQRIEDLGSVFHTHPATVAGVPIDLGGIEYRLNLCRECAFQFKSPPIDASRLLACYEQASSSHWEDDPDPHERQFDVLRDLVQMHDGNVAAEAAPGGGARFVAWFPAEPRRQLLPPAAAPVDSEVGA